MMDNRRLITAMLLGLAVISLLGLALASHEASASTSPASTEPLPSVRSRFSSRTFSEKGRRAMSKRPARASSRNTSNDRSPTCRLALEPNESGAAGMAAVSRGGPRYRPASVEL